MASRQPTGIPEAPDANVVRAIPRPDISVSQIVLLTLSQLGRASFRQLRAHPNARLLGAQRSENSFYTALARLKRRKAIIRTADHVYELTAHGEYAALKAFVRKEHRQIEQKHMAASKAAVTTWDGKWRIVLFDVPESKRPVRDYLRSVLKRHGFVEFQRSMWVWPHKLPAFITKLLADPQMRKYTRAITTYDIDYDDDLRRMFRLG